MIDDTTTETPAAVNRPPLPALPVKQAKIVTLVKGVRMNGFTLGKGQMVSHVSLPMAEKLERAGEVKILDIF